MFTMLWSSVRTRTRMGNPWEKCSRKKIFFFIFLTQTRMGTRLFACLTMCSLYWRRWRKSHKQPCNKNAIKLHLEEVRQTEQFTFTMQSFCISTRHPGWRGSWCSTGAAASPGAARPRPASQSVQRMKSIETFWSWHQLARTIWRIGEKWKKARSAKRSRWVKLWFGHFSFNLHRQYWRQTLHRRSKESDEPAFRFRKNLVSDRAVVGKMVKNKADLVKYWCSSQPRNDPCGAALCSIEDILWCSQYFSYTRLTWLNPSSTLPWTRRRVSESKKCKYRASSSWA